MAGAEGRNQKEDRLADAKADKKELSRLRRDIDGRRKEDLTLRLSGGAEEMAQVMEVLSMLGVDCEVLEDNRPQPMSELTQPDFASFVCFDLETSGTYGAANGDAPAEITEIGAVRVVNGEITETCSQLVNPGRKIIPRITHITGEMVVDQPGVEVFGIDQPDAHRAWCDTQANALLYGKLKELAR